MPGGIWHSSFFSLRDVLDDRTFLPKAVASFAVSAAIVAGAIVYSLSHKVQVSWIANVDVSSPAADAPASAPGAGTPALDLARHEKATALISEPWPVKLKASDFIKGDKYITYETPLAIGCRHINNILQEENPYVVTKINGESMLASLKSKESCESFLNSAPSIYLASSHPLDKSSTVVMMTIGELILP